MTSGFSGLDSTVSIISTITGIRSSLTPRVVMAAVPRRMPEVWNGERESKGTYFISRYVGFNQHTFGHLASQFREFGSEVDQNTVVVSATGNDLVSSADKFIGHDRSVFTHLCGIFLEFRRECFAESNGLGCDHMLQRSALCTRENGHCRESATSS